jgi:hypothetical protein
MQIFIVSRFTYLSISLFIGVLLAIIPQNGVMKAQFSQYQYINEIPTIAQALPLQTTQAIEFTRNSQNYQPSQTKQISQYNQDFKRYFVYVHGDNPQILQRISQVESSAYFRQYGGRTIIQAGVFGKPFNAQQRVNKLELNGICGAHFVGCYKNGTGGNNNPIYSSNTS